MAASVRPSAGQAVKQATWKPARGHLSQGSRGPPWLLGATASSQLAGAGGAQWGP